MLGWLPGCATHAVTWGSTLRRTCFWFRALPLPCWNFYNFIFEPRFVSDVWWDSGSGAWAEVMRTTPVFGCFVWLPYTLTLCALWASLSSYAVCSLALDQCAHDPVSSSGCWQPGEATLLHVNQIWTQKGESDIPRSMRDQGTRLSYSPNPYYVLLWADHWCWTGWPRRKGKGGTATVLPFQPLFIMVPRECASIKKWNETRWAAWRRVPIAPLRRKNTCRWKLPDMNCVFQWFCIPVKYSYICILNWNCIIEWWVAKFMLVIKTFIL